MSFKISADFGQRRLIGRRKTIHRWESEMRMCHSFSIDCVSENEGAERSVKLVAGKIETRKWLHGPACALDKTVMYPVSMQKL